MAFVPPGRQVTYTNYEPEEVVAALGGRDAIDGWLAVSYLPAAQAPVNAGLTPWAPGALVIAAGTPPPVEARFRSLICILQADVGQEDDVLICARLQDGSFQWISLIH
jgi:hypothetical protein